MKKTYIIPHIKLADTSFNPLMYTTSITNGGNGNTKSVDSKRRYIDDDIESDINTSSGFYSGWE